MMTVHSPSMVLRALLFLGLLAFGACAVQAGDPPERSLDGESPGASESSGAGGTAGQLSPQGFGTGGFGYPTTLVAIGLDTNLTGNATAGDATGYSFAQTGDRDDKRLYAGITFPLTSLPATALIDYAELRAQPISKVGNPNNTAMGNYLLDHVKFSTRGTIDNPTMVASGFATLFSAGGIQVGTAAFVNVTTRVKASWALHEPRVQFRVRPQYVSANGTNDRVSLRRNADENDSIVAPGVVDPDANNAMVLLIDYH